MSSFVQNFDVPSLANSYPYQTAFLVVLGALGVARLAFQTLIVLGQTFLLPGANLGKFGAKKGSWAVVTGASDGIGREFANQLAKAGFNVMLVARNEAVLSAAAADIAEKYGPSISTKIHVIDFSKKDEAAYESLAAACGDLDVGVLVNNVGKSHSIPAYFVDTPKEEIDDIVTINVSATIKVTYMILPGMIKRLAPVFTLLTSAHEDNTSKRGLILNIGSFAGAVPSPMLATYSGTKAFLATFTSALAEEVKNHNVTVQHLNTYFVTSKLSKIRNPSLLIPTPASYVRSALSKVGLACGANFSGRPNTTTPFWSHALLDYAITVIGWKSLFIGYTHSLHKSIRKRALKKQERDSKNR